MITSGLHKMFLSMRLTAFLACLAVILCGCATMRYPRAFKIEGKEFKEFKEIDDEKALKLVAQIYNLRHESWEEDMARKISLDEYISILRGRKSAYLRKSGIFNIKYEKIKLSLWKKEDLEKLYDLLEIRTENYHIETAYKLTELENAKRITYLTAINCVARELEKRENTDKVIATTGQILVTALSVAMQML